MGKDGILEIVETNKNVLSTLDQAIASTRAGDLEAYARVIDSCQAQVRALLGTLVFDDNDVNDLAQETFIFAYEHLSEYKSGTYFPAWLKAIARNKAMTHLRQRRRKRDSHRQWVSDQIFQRIEDSVSSDATARVDALSKCVDRLPDEQRAFMKSITKREGTLEKWSADAGLALTVVRKRISRIYVVLRNCIDKQVTLGDPL